jgi:hypothetical protein
VQEPLANAKTYLKMSAVFPHHTPRLALNLSVYMQKHGTSGALTMSLGFSSFNSRSKNVTEGMLLRNSNANASISFMSLIRRSFLLSFRQVLGVMQAFFLHLYLIIMQMTFYIYLIMTTILMTN